METKVQYVKDGWRSYGPPVLGAILVLLILFGGYSLWKGRQTRPIEIANPPAVNDLAQDLNNSVDLRLSPTPTPTVNPNTPRSNLGGGAVTPTPTKTPAQGGAATPSAGVKGGVLPKAGFPGFAVVAGLVASFFAGLKLSKYKKN